MEGTRRKYADNADAAPPAARGEGGEKMRVIAYCIKCKREIIKAKDYADAFKAIDIHLQRRHAIAWISPSGVPIEEYADILVKYLKGKDMDDYDKATLATILYEFAVYKEFFIDDNKRGIITDIFSIFKATKGVAEAFKDILQKRKGEWAWGRKLKPCRRHIELVREHYKVRGRISAAKFRDYGSPLIQCYKVSGLNLKYLL